MTAEQIIHEIESLPLEEQVKIIRFAYRLDGERQLTGRVSALAERMARTTDPAGAMLLREEISRGFYGGKANARNRPPQPPARLASTFAGLEYHLIFAPRKHRDTQNGGVKCRELLLKFRFPGVEQVRG